MIKLPFRRLFTCAFISSFALSACSQKTADIPLKGEASPYLFVFAGDQDSVSYTHLTLPTIYSV